MVVAATARAGVAVVRLGRVGWSTVEALQRALVAARQGSSTALRDAPSTTGTGQGPAVAEADDVLLLCEHPPVYTTGRRVGVRVPPSLDRFLRLFVFEICCALLHPLLRTALMAFE
jgi:lipoate-protein ligase B